MKLDKHNRLVQSAVSRALRSGLSLAGLIAGASALNGCEESSGLFNVVGVEPCRITTNDVNESEMKAPRGEPPVVMGVLVEDAPDKSPADQPEK